MFWLFIGVALGLPPAVLGSNGPTWVGTLPPGSGHGLVAVVDPVSGVLVVEAAERDGRLRRWADKAWSIDGTPLDPELPAVGHRMNGDTLVSAATTFGASHQFQYDADGRMSKVLWANGAQMRVRYDGEGRVREINGPGTRRLSLGWANGLRWTDGLGRAHHLRTAVSGPVKKVSLTDPVGRTVSSHYRKREDVWALTGWTDPRGLETRIGTYAGRMDLTVPGGRVYRMEVGPEGQVQSLGGRQADLFAAQNMACLVARGLGAIGWRKHRDERTQPTTGVGLQGVIIRKSSLCRRSISCMERPSI